jgi:hypothetical protein
MDLDQAASFTPALIAMGLALLGSLVIAFAAGEWMVERRTRTRRVRAAAAGGRSSRTGAAALRVSEPRAWRQKALSMMRRSTERVTVVKDRQLSDTRRLLVSAGHRGRDAIVVYAFF